MLRKKRRKRDTRVDLLHEDQWGRIPEGQLSFLDLFRHRLAKSGHH